MDFYQILMQRFFRAGLRAFVAENAFCPVFALAGFFVDLHVHGADSETLPTMDALILIAVDAQQRKIAHGLEKHRDGTQILAERPIIFESEGKRNADNIVKCIPGEE